MENIEEVPSIYFAIYIDLCFPLYKFRFFGIFFARRHTTHKSESVFLYERYSDYEGSDEDFEFPPEFDEAETRKALLDSPNCAKIVLRLSS